MTLFTFSGVLSIRIPIRISSSFMAVSLCRSYKSLDFRRFTPSKPHLHPFSFAFCCLESFEENESDSGLLALHKFGFKKSKMEIRIKGAFQNWRPKTNIRGIFICMSGSTFRGHACIYKVKVILPLVLATQFRGHCFVYED